MNELAASIINLNRQIDLLELGDDTLPNLYGQRLQAECDLYNYDSIDPTLIRYRRMIIRLRSTVIKNTRLSNQVIGVLVALRDNS